MRRRLLRVGACALVLRREVACSGAKITPPDSPSTRAAAAHAHTDAQIATLRSLHEQRITSPKPQLAPQRWGRRSKKRR